MSAQTATILLVHGGFVDGSGWEGVYQALASRGRRVSVAQISTESLQGDVAAVTTMIDAAEGSVILVGHSYGGVVITEAGNHPKVVGLVYVTAFAPDVGESVGTLIADPAPGAPVPPIIPTGDGHFLLDRVAFAEAFAADIDAKRAAFMADAQVPWGAAGVDGKVTAASWRKKPSWYLIATDDRMIPPEVQRFMAERAGSTTVESPGSHSVYISHAETVASVITTSIQAL